jgi:NAD(P)-dependent dehydrogenase (short-subunit alcohol dehydrogenase family)
VTALAGRLAVVTGAGRGIGKAIAAALAARGATVVVNDLHPERADEAVREIGGGAVARPFDVTDRAAVVRELAAIGPIDILVNNAGIPEGRFSGPFAESSPEDWATYVELNVYGAMSCFHAVVPAMCERGWGRLIQISSGSAARGLPPEAGESIYSGSKAFMDGLIRHLAIEVARHGVTVNSVAPGVMDAARAYAAPAVIDAVVARVPAGRLGRSEEVGDAVAWLASDAAGFVTGQVIHVNGGAYQGR